MSAEARRAAVQAVAAKRPVVSSVSYKDEPLPQLYGRNVFGDAEMRRRLPESSYKALRTMIETGEQLDHGLTLQHDEVVERVGGVHLGPEVGRVFDQQRVAAAGMDLRHVERPSAVFAARIVGGQAVRAPDIVRHAVCLRHRAVDEHAGAALGLEAGDDATDGSACYWQARHSS